VGKGKVMTIYIMYSNRIHEVQYQVHAIIFKRAVPYVITLRQLKC